MTKLLFTGLSLPFPAYSPDLIVLPPAVSDDVPEDADKYPNAEAQLFKIKKLSSIS